MKKVVVLTGSPRKTGNSNTMASSFIDELKAKGYKVNRFDTALLNIGTCKACEACYSKGNPCAFDDDFNCIAEAIDDSDIIAFIAPVYWFAFPAGLKAVIDKFHSFNVGGKSLKGKKTVLISCAAMPGQDVFKGIVYAYEMMVKLMKWKDAGQILIPGIMAERDWEKTDCEQQVKKLAAKL